MTKLLFGTAGIPMAAKGTDTASGIKAVRGLGLDALELEFVQSVNISRENAPKIKEVAEKEDVALTCHAPYYINLNAADAAKLEASKKRLVKAAEIAWLCGGRSVAFHPGYYLGEAKEKVYDKVKQQLKEVVDELKNIGCDIVVRPETTGKRTQFGDLNEIMKLSQELEQVLPCIDYAHMHAREQNNNSASEFNDILAAVERELGKEALKNMHIQIAGVNYSDKGELNHLELKESDLNYNGIVESWKEFKIAGIVISESPNIEGDAIMLKNLFERGS
ncbi:MAG TPA: TIM barrel protein [Candidatus Nanoarchaeia archaeon]|nr:TIM barrel protein [Candidatus Nanoarchaeia archaeon]